jgi:hypothetical protein
MVLFFLAMCLKRFYHHQNAHDQENHYWYFIEPTVPNVRAFVNARFELFIDRTTSVVITQENEHQQQLSVHPT